MSGKNAKPSLSGRFAETWKIRGIFLNYLDDLYGVFGILEGIFAGLGVEQRGPHRGVAILTVVTMVRVCNTFLACLATEMSFYAMLKVSVTLYAVTIRNGRRS